MPAPKAVKFVAAPEGYSAIPPEEFAVVGDIPGGESGPVAIGDVSGLQSALDGKADQSALDAAIARIEALESASGGD